MKNSKEKCREKCSIDKSLKVKIYDMVTEIDSQILEKIQISRRKLKTSPHVNLPEVPLDCQLYDQEANYYDKFWKLYLHNEMNLKINNSIRSQVRSLTNKLNEIKYLLQTREQILIESEIKKNRKKRNTGNKDNLYQCKIQNCRKKYQWNRSLIVHLRTKHKNEISLNQNTKRQSLEVIQSADEIQEDNSSKQVKNISKNGQEFNNDKLFEKSKSNDLNQCNDQNIS